MPTATQIRILLLESEYMVVPQIIFETLADYHDALALAAAECGIDREYWDIFHHRHEISADSIARILTALGWDISSVEKINERRRRLFGENNTSLLPKTLVVSESEKSIPLTLRAPATGSAHFQIA